MKFRKTSLDSQDNASRHSRDLFAMSDDSNSRSAQALITNKAENPFRRGDRPTLPKDSEAFPAPTIDIENKENSESDKSSVLDALNKPEVKRTGPKSMREKLANLRKNQKKTAAADRTKKTQSKIQFGKRKLSEDDTSNTITNMDKRQKTPAENGTANTANIAMDQFAASDDE